MDQKFFLLIFEYTQKNKCLSKISLLITKASSRVFFCIYVALLLYLYSFSREDFFISLITPAIVLCLNLTLRSIIKRRRPFEAMNIKSNLKKSKSYSFPSNHSSSAMIIALMFLQQNIIIGVVVIALAICTGISRILTGVHYPCDVLVAFLISITIFIII